MISKIPSDPSPLSYIVFSNGLRKYAIWVHVFSKGIEHCHFVQNFIPVDQMLSKIQSESIELRHFFFKNGMANFWKMFLISIYIVKHIRQSASPPFRQSVSPSVRQSVSSSVRQYVRTCFKSPDWNEKKEFLLPSQKYMKKKRKRSQKTYLKEFSITALSRWF